VSTSTADREAASGVKIDEFLFRILGDIPKEDQERIIKKFGPSILWNPQDLNNEVVFDLLSLMLEKPENYRFHLAVILSQISLQGMPKELKSRLEHALGLSDDGLSPNHPRFKIKLNYEGWWLCGKAEPRLKDSIKRRAVMLVNDGELLVKFTGRLTALCLKTFTTNDGCAFLAGVWYSPIDEEIRPTDKQTVRNSSPPPHNIDN
jgi:hypothetical protein